MELRLVKALAATSGHLRRLSCIAVSLLFFSGVLLAPEVLAQEDDTLLVSASPYPVSPNGEVTLSARYKGSISGQIEYRFSFGDGSAPSPFSSSSTISHRYANLGHYDASVQVRDESGVLGIRRVRITVATSPSGPFPVHSTSVLVGDSERYFWVVNPDNNSVSRLGPKAKVLEVPLGARCHPERLAHSKSGEIWITCSGSDRIQVVSPDAKVVSTIVLPYGASPFGIVASPDGENIYVSLYGRGTVARFSASARTQTSELYLGPTPRALALTGDGTRLFVTRFISSNEGGEVWEVSVANEGLTLSRTIQLPADLFTPDTQASGRGVPNYLASIAIDPTNSYALVTANKANIFRGLFLDGNDLNTVNTIRAMIAKIDVASGREIISARRDIDNSESPSAVAFSPLGDYAFVTLQGNNFVAVYDMFTNEQSGTNFHTTLARLATGLAPQGIVFDTARTRLLVHNFMERSVSLLSAESFLRGTSSLFERTDVRSVERESLEPLVLLGKQIFYNASDNSGREGRSKMSSEGYFSCATCHINGGHDGRTWDFSGRGEGLRNTTDLRGRAGTGHGRVHWSANFDEIHDFENDIRNAFGGDGFLSDDDFAQTSDPLGTPKAGRSTELDALSAYVSSLSAETYPRSPFRPADGRFSAAAQEGSRIFVEQNCSSCHSGATFTDSSSVEDRLHNVGTISDASGGRLGATLVGIDTPTLLGLWDTFPYLHDGSASSLDEVMTSHGGRRLQAELALLSGGATATSAGTGARAHGGSYVTFAGPGSTVNFSSIHGGTGGFARLRLRYANLNAANSFHLSVNGTPLTVALEATQTELQSEGFVLWREDEVAVELPAGAVSSLSVSVEGSATEVALDEITVSTADVLRAASVHSRVGALDELSRVQLLTYLLELDGRDTNGNVGTTLFRGYNLGGPSLHVGGDLFEGKQSSNHRFIGREGRAQVMQMALSEQETALGNTYARTKEVIFSGFPEGEYKMYLYTLSGPGSASGEIEINGKSAPPISLGTTKLDLLEKHGPFTIIPINGEIVVKTGTHAAAIAAASFYATRAVQPQQRLLVRGRVGKKMIALRLRLTSPDKGRYSYIIRHRNRTLKKIQTKKRRFTLRVRKPNRKTSARKPEFLSISATGRQGDTIRGNFAIRGRQ